MPTKSGASVGNLRGASAPPRGEAALAIGILYQREPRQAELSSLVTCARQHGMANLARLLFNTNEFLYAD